MISAKEAKELSLKSDQLAKCFEVCSKAVTEASSKGMPSAKVELQFDDPEHFRMLCRELVSLGYAVEREEYPSKAGAQSLVISWE